MSVKFSVCSMKLFSVKLFRLQHYLARREKLPQNYLAPLSRYGRHSPLPQGERGAMLYLLAQLEFRDD